MKLSDILDRKFLHSLSWEHIRTGQVGPLEETIDALIDGGHGEETLRHLEKMVTDNSKNILFVCTILHILSHREYDEVDPIGVELAAKFLDHEGGRVAGYALKCFSNWNHKETLGFLEAMKPTADWVRKDGKRIMEHIRDFGRGSTTKTRDVSKTEDQ